MALQNTTKLIYLNISSGKICRRVPEATPDSITRTNKNGIRVHEEHYDRGMIKDIRTRTHEEYGKFWELYIEDEGCLYMLQFKYSSGYANGFLKTIKNADLSRPLTLIPYSKEENGKLKTTLFISQDGRALKHYYTKENPNGLPQLKKVKVKGVERWDDTDTMEFLEHMITTDIKPLLSGNLFLYRFFLLSNTNYNINRLNRLKHCINHNTI